MILGSMEKQPGETRRLVVDWADRFLATSEGEQITAVSIEIPDNTVSSPLAVSEVTVPPYDTGYFLVSGGVDGTEYTIEITATTSLGQIIEDEVKVVVEEID
jgi:hypothetical protein